MRMSRRLGIYGGKKKTVKYKGAAALGNTMYNPATAKIGDYAIFVGINSASAVNRSLTVTELSGSINADQGKGASLPSYAVFLSGWKNQFASGIAYDSSLTATSNLFSSYSYRYGGVAVIGNYAIWVGGINSSGSVVKNAICCDNSLTSQSISDLDQDSWQYNMAYGTTNYYGTENAVFFGSGALDIYDSSLSYSHTTLQSGVNDPWMIVTYTSVNFNGNIICPDLVTYSLLSISGYGTVAVLPATGIEMCEYIASAEIEDQSIVFAGALDSNDVYAYDKSFTQSIIDSLSQSRIAPGAISIGNVALFGGGCSTYSDLDNGGTAYNTIDAYEFS